MKTALIFGAGGQDGSYLAPFLLDRGYRVVGVHRRSSNDNTGRLTEIKNGCRFSLLEGDLTDSNSVSNIISTVGPDEIYNLAAQSHVHTSFHQPELTFQVNTIGVLHILESIRHHAPHSKFYQASTSELFGVAYDLDAQGRRIQDERTVFAPCSPYGCAKLAAHELVNVYRTSYRLLCCAGILFNHESPRRGENFVTRKITKYVAALYHHLDAANGTTNRAAKNAFPKLKLGNTKSARDWSHAKDMVRAMWMMLQAETLRDYVVSSDESHTVEDFLDHAFRIIGQDWRDWVETDKDLLRPTEVPHLHGSSRRICQELGWTPDYSFDGLVEEMVTHDIEEFQRGVDSNGSPPHAPMLKTHLPAA